MSGVFGFVVQDRRRVVAIVNDDIHAAIVIEIAESRAACGFDNSETAVGCGGHHLEFLAD